MKKTIILGLAVAVMTVTSFTVLADSKYPAADFEPQVIFIDNNLAAQTATPASNAQTAVPCPANTVASATAQPAADEFDPKYPAANFHPKVIYP
jgi:L-fucose mutarotase/ribose pyranase (RbsD/FucU family)